jgi:hypothetical protein
MRPRRLVSAAYQLTNDHWHAYDLAINALRPTHGSATLVRTNDMRGHAAVLALLAFRVDAVDLKYRLGNVETDGCDRLHDWLSCSAYRVSDRDNSLTCLTPDGRLEKQTCHRPIALVRFVPQKASLRAILCN